MHITLTDVLSCPRCGPEFGLIALADRMEDRRVREGRLGCANCREEFAIEEGVPDLRFPPGKAEAGVGAEFSRGEDWPLQTAALLGITEGRAVALVVGPGAERLGDIAELVPRTQIVGAAPGLVAEPERAGESRVRIRTVLPFRSRSLHGVALTGAAAESMLDEAVRVLAPGARLVVDPAGDGTADALRERGLEILLEQSDVVVASSS